MNPTDADPLAGLRDIHLPAEPSAWPPGPGWWLLLGLFLLLTLLAALAWRRHRQQARHWMRRAEAELSMLRADDGLRHDPAAVLREAGALLRRCARCRDPERAPGLAGNAWADYLRSVAGTADDDPVWQAMAIERYRPAGELPDPERVFSACERWIGGLGR